MLRSEIFGGKCSFFHISFDSFIFIRIWQILELLLFLSGRNESDADKNIEREKAFAKTKEYVWHQNKSNVREAKC